MKKQLAALILIFALILALSPAAAALTLEGKTALRMGESTQWKATDVPEGEPVLWSSEDPAVASVDETGRITGHKPGKSRISAAAGEQTEAVTMAVYSDPVTEIRLSGHVRLRVGESTCWTATPVPEDAATVITWLAGNPSVATVDETGRITGHKPGKCHITAMASNGVKRTVTVLVYSDPMEGIQLAGQVLVKVGDVLSWKAAPLPKTAYTSFTWTAGNPGVATVDQNGTITTHKPGQCHITVAAACGMKKTVTLTVKTEYELMADQFPDVLAKYDSPHTAIAARTNNLVLACNAIDGTVVHPGEIFSFNETVGERTAEKGYREAAIFTEGTTQPAVGGGVCQVASTIYMAALLADLKTVERTEHMFRVTYVPPGMDATIYWGSLDYKFKNDREDPVAIRASVSGGQVHIALLGKKKDDTTVKMTYTTADGYRVQTYKNYYDGSGKLLRTEKCTLSNYQPMPKEES